MVSVEWVGDGRMVLNVREHTLEIDRSPTATDDELRPGELFLMALGACTVGTLMKHEAVKALPIRQLRVELAGERATGPNRYGQINLQLMIDGDLTEDQRARVVRVAQNCVLHNTITHSPKIEVSITSEMPVNR